MERLATDRHYFAKPVRTLFNDVRHFFPIGEQLRVYRVCERAHDARDRVRRHAAAHGHDVRRQPGVLPRQHAPGTACARVPLPGSKYCPSHKHLDEEFEVVAAA